MESSPDRADGLIATVGHMVETRDQHDVMEKLRGIPWKPMKDHRL